VQSQNQLELLSAQRRSLLRENELSGQKGRQVRLWALQRRLGRDQMIFHITEINSSYYLSFIDRSGINIRKVTLSEREDELFREALESVVTGRTNLNLLYEIGRLIGIEAIPERFTSVILIPDGYFHQLPLAILPVNEPATPFSYGASKYFIELKDVYTLNSINELFETSSRHDFDRDFAGFGVADFRNEQTSRNLVSLPKAPEEIERVLHRLYRFPAAVGITNEQATSSLFKEMAGSSRILHMATHSEVSESDPLFSRLHFYTEGNAEDDGQLFAYELFGLDLRNELVMLNSCESGGDRYLRGSGIMGINRALRYAGVQSLLLNGWSVNDHFATEFAELFYHYLNRGKTKSTALQAAKMEFMRTQNANPHYWGPYMLNGNNRPLLERTDRAAGSSVLMALLFIAAVVVVQRNNNRSRG
jgi:CHAT domain-containing protein